MHDNYRNPVQPHVPACGLPLRITGALPSGCMALAFLLFACTPQEPTPSQPTGSSGASTSPDTQNQDTTSSAGESATDAQSDNDSGASTKTPSESQDTTSTSPGPESTTQDPAPGDPTTPKLWIPPNTELCGSIHWTVKDFQKEFATRHKIKIKSGSFPLDAVRLSGSMHYQQIEGSFESELLTLQGHQMNTPNAQVMLEETAMDFGQERMIGLSFTLSAQEDGHFQTFVLDSFENTPETRLNRFDASSDKAVDLLGGYLGAGYGPCKINNAPTEVFHFEFDNGDFVDFHTRTRLHSFNRPMTQHGVTLRATGKLGDHSFDVTHWEDLIYGTKEISDFYRFPSLAVRVPEHDGVCGIGLKRDAFDEDMPYRAELLDCELKVKEKRTPSGFKHPDRFVNQ